MFAVVAHEYGHLRGDHGKLSAWVYRTRMSWARLSRRYEEGSSALGWLMAGFDDTHPVLKDRLASLGQAAGLQRLSAMHSLRLLGQGRARIALALDAAWWQANRADWRAHGERLRALNQEAQALSQRAHELKAEEWLRWADAVESLSDKDPTPWLEHALLLAPEDPHALRRLWRERLESSRAMEESAWERFQQLMPWEQGVPAQLDEALDDLAQRVYDASDLPGRARVVVLGRHVPAKQLEQARELKLLVQRR